MQVKIYDLDYKPVAIFNLKPGGIIEITTNTELFTCGTPVVEYPLKGLQQVVTVIAEPK